jgi:hypothetical protein
MIASPVPISLGRDAFPKKSFADGISAYTVLAIRVPAQTIQILANIVDGKD